MTDRREYPDRPVVGVGGVVIAGDCVLLIRRGSEPLKGSWSIPGGTLELGESLVEGVRRELKEETGLDVTVGELIEAFERVFPDGDAHPRYHFVILDYLCEGAAGQPRPGGDVTQVAMVSENDLERYQLSEAATRVIRKAFAMARARRASTRPQG